MHEVSHASDILISAELINEFFFFSHDRSDRREWIMVQLVNSCWGRDYYKIRMPFPRRGKVATVWSSLVDIDGRGDDWYSRFERRNKVSFLSKSDLDVLLSLSKFSNFVSEKWDFQERPVVKHEPVECHGGTKK